MTYPSCPAAQAQNLLSLGDHLPPLSTLLIPLTFCFSFIRCPLEAKAYFPSRLSYVSAMAHLPLSTNEAEYTVGTGEEIESYAWTLF